MNRLFKNGRVNTVGNQCEPMDLWVEKDHIQALESNLSEEGMDEVIDLDGQLLIPGLIDIHVHLREPGYTEKETIASGSKAAARGGFTTICAMPNVLPVPDTMEKFDKIQNRIEETACVRTFSYAPITKALVTDELTDLESLQVVGACGFTNDGVGVQTAGTMYRAMKEVARIGAVLVAHTEDDSLVAGGVLHEGLKSRELSLPGIPSVTESTQIARDVLLAEATGARYHVCHVSAKESVRVIRDAKRAGIPVTAEVTPHHLILCDEDIPSNQAIWKMNPPLRSKEDRMALIEGLLDGTIDCIATDHAPHTKEEKQGGFIGSPFGIVGLETAFGLLYTHLVLNDVCTLEQLLNWMTTQPANVLNLPYHGLQVGAPADFAVMNITDPYEIRTEDFLSKNTNTPFHGWKVVGTCLRTYVDGVAVWEQKREGRV